MFGPAALRWIVVAVALLSEHEAKEIVGKVVRIADGDTLTVLDSQNEQQKIRLSGIDASEKGQAFGTKAKDALAEKVHEKTVRIVWKQRDRYGRIVGDVHLGDRNINAEMVRDGFAWRYRQYAPKDKALEAAEQEARKDLRGLWRDKSPESCIQRERDFGEEKSLLFRRHAIVGNPADRLVDRIQNRFVVRNLLQHLAGICEPIGELQFFKRFPREFFAPLESLIEAHERKPSVQSG